MTQLDAKQTTKAIKQHLLVKFGIKATVRSKQYAGGSSINIEYKGGVVPSEVEKVLVGIESRSFDPMQDLELIVSGKCVIDGKGLKRYGYCFVRREISDEFWSRLAQFVSSKQKYADIHDCVTMEDFERQFKSPMLRSSWNWRDFIREIAADMSLVTDDLDAIEFLDAFPTGNWNIGFLYAYKGKAYSTIDLPL